MKETSKKHKLNIKPLGDRVLIKEQEASTKERTTASGIIIPITVNDDKGSKKGEVVAVGPGHYEDGELIPVGVEVGDTVLFNWGDKVKIDDNEYFIARESELIAIVG